MPNDPAHAGDRPCALTARLVAYLRQWFFGRVESRHAAVRNLYLRLLGAIYLSAFVSFWAQVDGLIGNRGILPIAPYLSALRQQAGFTPWRLLPTFCWLSASDTSLHIQCTAGVLLSILLIVGVTPALTTAMLWVLYLSLCVAGQSFFEFQWDLLLLEAGFLAIFFSPLKLLLSRARHVEPAAIVLWLQRWLIFRLMFLSGVSKIASGDSAWRDGSALSYHYQTQPLPPWTSWYFQHQPHWMAHASTHFTLTVELILPLLMLGPRRLRQTAFASTVLLQILIAATGNYGFFNLLAMVLCLPLLDDQAIEPVRRLSRWILRPKSMDAPRTLPPAPTFSRLDWPKWVTIPLAILIGLITLPQVLRATGVDFAVVQKVEPLTEWATPFRSVNRYGLFATMTRTRPEIIIEISDDRAHWTEVAFRWKPGDLKKRPQFCTPHMPRLDWQMWFAALDWQDNADVIEGLFRGILSGNPSITGLLAPNNYASHPPRCIRAAFYDYTFTTSSERAASGAWWKRTAMGRRTPAYSLEPNGDLKASGLAHALTPSCAPATMRRVRHTLALVGAGNMAEAIVRGILRAGVLSADEMIAADVAEPRRALFHNELGIQTVSENAEAARGAQMLLLSVKPQQMKAALSELAEAVDSQTLFISIAAGISANFIESQLGSRAKWRVVRTMPNTPMLVGEGMVAISRGSYATDADVISARKIFEAAAKVVEVPESLLDAVTAVSGSGPAYFFYLVEQMIAAGVSLGLDPATARALAVQTAQGSSRMLAQSNESPQELRRRVTSPNGTTHAAITHFEQQQVGETIIGAIQAAARRSKELGL